MISNLLVWGGLIGLVIFFAAWRGKEIIWPTKIPMFPQAGETWLLNGIGAVYIVASNNNGRVSASLVTQQQGTLPKPDYVWFEDTNRMEYQWVLSEFQSRATPHTAAPKELTSMLDKT